MAVKVRCPTCEKVLSAPDTARGKAVKCPACETRVKVPEGQGEGSPTPARRSGPQRPVKAKQPAPGSDSTEFLAGLDFNKVVDSSEQMCPKCGAEIPDEATECPKCGVDINTGQLTAAAKKRKGRKGPDPALFYSAAWSDSWAFVKSNYTVALRTGMYFTIFQFASGLCQAMVQYCETGPPKFFWGTLGLAASLVVVGWPWHLTVETIRTTVVRKTNVRDVHLDIFQSIALGVKMILWLIAFCWFPPAFIMYPLAMIHMAMPVTKRAWFNFLMVTTFFRNLGPTLYYWVVAIVVNLSLATVVAAGYGLLAWLYPSELVSLVIGRKAASTRAEWIVVGGMLISGVISSLVSGFTLLFTARVMGLFAYYYKDTLDLVTLVTEKTYVHKEVKRDAFGDPIKSTGQKVGGVLFILVILGVIAGVAYFVYYQLKK